MKVIADYIFPFASFSFHLMKKFFECLGSACMEQLTASRLHNVREYQEWLSCLLLALRLKYSVVMVLRKLDQSWLRCSDPLVSALVAVVDDSVDHESQDGLVEELANVDEVEEPCQQGLNTSRHSDDADGNCRRSFVNCNCSVSGAGIEELLRAIVDVFCVHQLLACQLGWNKNHRQGQMDLLAHHSLTAVDVSTHASV